MTRTQLKAIKDHAQQSGQIAAALKDYERFSKEIVAGTDYLIKLNMLTNGAQLEILEVFQNAYERECLTRGVIPYDL